MNRRKVAMMVAFTGGILGSLGGLGILDIGWLIWPVALATIVAAAIVITTPTEKEIGNG